jgi:hypothetical protein
MWHSIAVLEVLNILKDCIYLKNWKLLMSQWSRSFDFLTIEDEGNLVLFNIRSH